MTIKKVASRKTSPAKNKKTKGGKKRSASEKKGPGVVGTAIDAAVEIGHAAESLKESFDHVQKARQKGGKVLKKAKRALKGGK